MRNGVQIDLSAKITGYQSSLQQLKQALNQLDPGASIKKSLEAAFKNAEDYVNKLAKKPIVNVSSESQLKSLETSLENAYGLINKVSQGFANVNINDMTPDALNAGLQQTIKLLNEAQTQLSAVANGPKLSQLGKEVLALKDLFTSMGTQFNNTTLSQGVELLTKKFQESKIAAQNAKEAYENAKKAVEDYQPVAATGIMSRAATYDKLQVMEPAMKKNYGVENIFSPEAINQMIENSMNQLRASLGNDDLFGWLSASIRQSFQNAFSEGLNSANLGSRLSQLAGQLTQVLNVGLPKNAISSNDIYKMIFGDDIKTKAGATNAFAEQIQKIATQLYQLSPAGQEAFQTLSRCVQVMTKWQEITPQQREAFLSGLQAGNLQEVKNQLEEIYQTKKQLNAEKNTQPLNDLKENARAAKEEYQQLTNEANKTQQALNTLKGTPQFQQMQKTIADLTARVQQLEEKLALLRGSNLNNLKDLGLGAGQNAKQFQLATAEVQKYQAALDRVRASEQFVGKLQGVIQRWFSIYAVVRMVSNAIKSMISTISELDKTITNISIVTDMSQSDLWSQMPQYSATAREFAASISGVYEVSQLYYQQGLQTNDVMKLTEATLKMARISGLQYADATDYMTNALRSFKMQMSDAERIVNVYSAIAASSATSSKELAEAMSKTASSAQAVGSSFENTTAMMAVMIEATRQAPENIGSALKSIISRYGQLKTNPATLVDAEGEALSLNKVDTALQSVGISIHNAQGQFRDFDEVIMELAASWDTIDVNTQRYIATIMAGNRQQSRFLALVSSYDRLKELSETAADAENAGQLQYLKTLDSIQAKQQQLKTSLQSLYTESGIQDLYATLLSLGKSILDTFNNIPKWMDKPILAIAKFGQLFISTASLITKAFTLIRSSLNLEMKKLQIQQQIAQGQITANSNEEALRRKEISQDEYQYRNRLLQQYKTDAIQAEGEITNATTTQSNNRKNRLSSTRGRAYAGMALTAAGIGATTYAATLGEDTQSERNLKGIMTMGGSVLQGAGTGAMMGGVWGGVAGAVVGVLLSMGQALSIFTETAEQKIARLDKAYQDASNKELVAKDQLTTLVDYKKKLEDLEKEMQTSNEAKQQWVQLNAEIANKYPELIKGIDEEGNLIVELGQAYDKLKKSKQDAYNQSAVEVGKTALKNAQDFDWLMKQYSIPTDKTSAAYAYVSRRSTKELMNSGDYNADTFLQSLFGQDSFIRRKDYLTGSSTIQVMDQALAKFLLQFHNNNSSFKNISTEELTHKDANYLVYQFGEALRNFEGTFDEFIDGLDDSILSAGPILEQQKAQLKAAQDNRIQGIITTQINNLRKLNDSLYDQEQNIVGFAAVYMNTMLNKSYQTFKQDAKESQNEDLKNAALTGDDATLWSTWAKNFNAQYLLLYNNIVNNKQLFSEIQQFYNDLQNINGDIEKHYEYSSLDEDKQQILKERLDTLRKNARQLLTSALIGLFGDIESENDQQILQNILDQYQQEFSTKQQGLISEIIPKLNIHSYESFNLFIKSLDDVDFLNQILQLLANGSLDSISGIEQIIAKYATKNNLERGTAAYDADPFINLLKGFENSIKVNFNTEFQTLAEQYTNNLKEFDKSLKNATQGMGLEDAVKLAQKLNVSLSDFDFRNGKFYYEDIAKLREVLMPKNIGLQQELQKRLKDAEKVATGGQIEGTEQYKKQIQEIADDFNNSSYDSWDKYIEQYKGNITELNKATDYYIRSSLLQQGKIKEFLSKFENLEGVNESNLYSRLLSGNIPQQLRNWQKQLLEYYQKGAIAVYDAATKLLNGQSALQQITVTESNRELLKNIKGVDDSEWKNGETIISLTQKQALDNFNLVIGDMLLKQGQGWKTRIDNAAKLWNARFSHNNFDAITDALSSWQEMDFTTMAMLPQSLRNLVELNKVTGKWTLNINEAAKILTSQNIATEFGITDIKQINEIRASVLKAQREKSAITILPDIIKNRQKLSEENITSIANLLNMSYDDALVQLKALQNDDGSYRVDLGNLRELMEEKGYVITNQIQQLFAEAVQSAVESFQNISKNMTTGFTNISDMQKIMNQFEQANYQGLSMIDGAKAVFEWNETLHAYVLSTNGLFHTILLAKQQLQNGTEEQKAAAQQLINDTERQLKENIDFSNFISATHINEDTKSFKEFKKAIDDYNTYLQATGQYTRDFTLQLNQILAGGETGVQAAQYLARQLNKQLTSEDINNIYKKRSNALVAAMQQLNASVGTIVSNEAAGIIEVNGGAITRLADGSNVVQQSATDLVKAYEDLYYLLADSGTATTAELNNVVAQEMMAWDNANVISALTGLTEMTYQALANIFTAAGKQLTPSLIEDLFYTNNLTSLGGGKVRINDFETFAKAMGITDTNSEQYIKAFNTFNEQMIKVNTQVSSNIKSAADQVLSARAGDQINLTELYARINDVGKAALEKALGSDASIEKGILTIKNTKNLEGIYQVIAQVSQQAGLIVQADIREMGLAIMKNKRENNINKVVTDIANDANQLTEESVQQLANALGLQFDTVLAYLKMDKDGYFKVDKYALNDLINISEKGKDISEKTRIAINNIVSKQIEDAENILNNLSNQVSNGFTNFSEIQKILDTLNLNSNDNIDVGLVVEYSESLNKWLLTTNGLMMQMQLAAQSLEDAGYTEQQVKNSLLSMRQQLADSIDVMSYIDADIANKEQVKTDLKRSIDLFNAAGQAIGNQTGIGIDQLTLALEQGGMTAVHALQQFAAITKQKFSSQDYLKVFQKGATQITTAISEINTEVGGLISKETAELLGLSNFTYIESTGKYLVSSTTDLVAAYGALLESMIDNNGQIKAGITLAQVNDTIANMYTEENYKNSFLSKISGRTIELSSLKQFATKAGYKLDEFIYHLEQSKLIELDKATGKYNILDFSNFTATLGIEKQVDGKLTQAYKDAYSAWADSLIEQTTKDSEAIKTGLNNLISAKEGDYVNISNLLNSVPAEIKDNLIQVLENYHVRVTEGVAYINQLATTNLEGMISTILSLTNTYRTKEGNELVAAAKKQQRESSVDKLYSEILSQRESLNEDNLLAIANALNVTYDQVEEALKDRRQADGTYKLRIDDVINIFGDKISTEASEQAEKIIKEILSTTLEALSGLGDKTFSLAEIQSTINDLKTKTGKNISSDQLFVFNDALGGYILTTTGIYTQFKIAALEAKTAGAEAQQLLEQKARELLNNVSITDLINNLQGNVEQAIKSQEEFTRAMQNYTAAMTALGKGGGIFSAKSLMDALQQGGAQAVAAAKVIASYQGKQLSNDDAVTIFRSKVEKLITASEQLLTVGIGGVISSTTADILNYKKDSKQRLSEGGSAVLQTAQDLVDAFLQLYGALEESGAATLSELNKVMSEALNAKFEQKHGSNKGIEYLSKAASMTYEQFGEMLAQAGVALTEEMFEQFTTNKIVSELGGGLIRIEDFAAIARNLGIEQNSEQYTKAFKAYNDAIIELDNQVADNILDEISSIAEATTGRKNRINVTQLWSKLTNTQIQSLNESLRQFGAWIDDGILNITEKANLPGIIAAVTRQAQEGKLILQREVAELADTLAQLLHQFAGTIADAISSGLTKTDAYILQQQAKNWFGIDLNFTKTYDGLKLSVDQANHLYQVLKGVDNTAAHLVFTELKDSLTEVNEQLETASDTAAEIKRLEEQLPAASEKQNAVLKERLALYKEIQQAQMDNPESYDFMGKSLPNGMKGAENYWNSIGKSFKTLNEAYKKATDGDPETTATLPLQDFYNMVNEFNNLAKISGTTVNFLGMQLKGDMQSAAAAIEAGFAAITNIDGEGAAINLQKLGIDFSGAAQGMTKGVHAGIQEMARGQIEMLDGLIQLLETIVAMEQFKGLDTDFDGTLGLGQLFDQVENGMYVAKGEAKEAAQRVLQAAEENEDLKKGLQQIEIDGKSILSYLKTLNSDAELSKEQAEQLSAVLSSLYEQFMTGNYNLQQLEQSILEIQRNSQRLTTIKLGTQRFLVGQGYQLKIDENGNILDPEDNILGTIANPQAAIQKYKAQQTAKILAAFEQGKYNDQATVELDDKVIHIKQNTLLVKQGGLIYAAGQYYSDFDQAAAALSGSGVDYNIKRDLQHVSTYTRTGENGETITYQALCGFQWRVVSGENGNTYVDTKGRQFKSQEDVYNAQVLQQKMSWAKLSGTISGKEQGDVSATIDYGVGVQVKLGQNGELEYWVNDQKCKGRNDALRKAEEFVNQAFLKQVPSTFTKDQAIQTAVEMGIIQQIDTKDGAQWKIGNHIYKTAAEANEALLKTLYDENGQLRSDAGQRLVQLQNTAQVETIVTVKDKTTFNGRSVSQQQQWIQKLISGNKQDIKTYAEEELGLSIDWSDSSELTYEEYKQLAEATGVETKDIGLKVQANYNNDRVGTLVEIGELSGVLHLTTDLDETGQQLLSMVSGGKGINVQSTNNSGNPSGRQSTTNNGSQRGQQPVALDFQSTKGNNALDELSYLKAQLAAERAAKANSNSKQLYQPTNGAISGTSEFDSQKLYRNARDAAAEYQAKNGNKSPEQLAELNAKKAAERAAKAERELEQSLLNKARNEAEQALNNTDINLQGVQNQKELAKYREAQQQAKANLEQLKNQSQDRKAIQQATQDYINSVNELNQQANLVRQQQKSAENAQQQLINYLDSTVNTITDQMLDQVDESLKDTFREQRNVANDLADGWDLGKDSEYTEAQNNLQQTTQQILAEIGQKQDEKNNAAKDAAALAAAQEAAAAQSQQASDRKDQEEQARKDAINNEGVGPVLTQDDEGVQAQLALDLQDAARQAEKKAQQEEHDRKQAELKARVEETEKMMLGSTNSQYRLKFLDDQNAEDYKVKDKFAALDEQINKIEQANGQFTEELVADYQNAAQELDQYVTNKLKNSSAVQEAQQGRDAAINDSIKANKAAAEKQAQQAAEAAEKQAYEKLQKRLENAALSEGLQNQIQDLINGGENSSLAAAYNEYKEQFKDANYKDQLQGTLTDQLVQQVQDLASNVKDQVNQITNSSTSSNDSVTTEALNQNTQAMGELTQATKEETQQQTWQGNGEPVPQYNPNNNYDPNTNTFYPEGQMSQNTQATEADTSAEQQNTGAVQQLSAQIEETSNTNNSGLNKEQIVDNTLTTLEEKNLNPSDEILDSISEYNQQLVEAYNAALDSWNSAVQDAQQIDEQALQAAANALIQISEKIMQQYNNPDTLVSPDDTASDGLEAAAKATTQLGASAEQTASAVQQAGTTIQSTINTDTEMAGQFNTVAQQTASQISQMSSTFTASASQGATSARTAGNALRSIPSNIPIALTVSLTKEGEGSVKGTVNGQPLAVGQSARIQLSGSTAAKGGQAYATGKVLMGQLGPELVVSNGRYFVVGATGAEMVSLPKDAIVFNHLQTEHLLKHQKNGGRGIPVTNQRNAVSYAKGTGPAMSSASAALAQLKQIRAMWQAMLNASMRDLGSMAGLQAGKQGGGGGGGNNDPEQIRAIIEEIERWYNLLRQIDRLEQDITYQESLQAEIQSNRVANGKALYNSYKQQLEYLEQEIVRNQELADLQKSWYERKRNQLANSDYGLIFRYDENGQLQYRDGPNLGLDILEKLTERDIYGKTTGAAENAKTQIDYLKSLGFDIEKLKYNDDGTVIDEKSDDYKDNKDKIYQDMMENFWNNLDGWKDELDGIYDSYRDQLNNVLQNEDKRNQILQKIVDNQLSVQQDVIKAIESREQKLIDELQKQRDAFDKSTKNFIDGLNDQLNQEKQLYQNAETQKELVKLRRQVAILQRSGGSGSQIRSLQDQIAAKEQDQYFTAQQQQIAAIQKASDLQIKRLDAQIDLMTQTLKYQKENGLLWDEVYQIMAGTPQQIRQFITENTPDFQSASALDVAEKVRDIDLRINEWTSYRDDENAPDTSGNDYFDWSSYSQSRSRRYGKIWESEYGDQIRAEFDRILNETGDINEAGRAADALIEQLLGRLTPEQLEDLGLHTPPVQESQEEKTKPTSDQLAWQHNRDQQYQRYADSLAREAQQEYNNNQQKLVKEMQNLQSSIKQMGYTSGNLTFAQMQFNQDFDQLSQYNRKKYGFKKYAKGGLISYTGIAQVDGTPSRPQAFLNAQQTALLRDKLFGSSDSLLSFTRDLVQQLHGISYNSDTYNKAEDSSIVIQNVDVNVNVSKIANDYDVRAIGNTVMQQMVKIARKSGTRGINRR